MWIEIFRSGTHTDSSGDERNYSDSDLSGMAEIYNSKVAESDAYQAPLVKGHPGTGDPAYGWVERLSRRGSSLLAKIGNIDLQTSLDVRNGLYRKISSAFYPDMLLRHVGLLGAASPAVRGMQNVSFAGFTDSFSEFAIESNPLQAIEDNTDNRASENELESLKAELAALRSDARQKEFREFAMSLIENRESPLITPAQTEPLIKLLEKAYESDCRTGSEFSDGHANAAGSGLCKEIRNFISSLNPLLNLGRMDTGRYNSSRGMDDDQFAGRKVREDRLALHHRALEIKAADPALSYEESVIMAGEKQ